MAFLRQSGVADARVMRTILALEHAFTRIENPMAVRIVDHVVEIGDVLLLHKVAQDVHVAVRFRVGRKNVMVGNDDHFVAVPDFRILAELAFEHTDGARPADVMGHQHIGLDPHIISGLDSGLAGRARQNLFSQRHSFAQSN